MFVPRDTTTTVWDLKEPRVEDTFDSLSPETTNPVVVVTKSFSVVSDLDRAPRIWWFGRVRTADVDPTVQVARTSGDRPPKS